MGMYRNPAVELQTILIIILYLSLSSVVSFSSAMILLSCNFLALFCCKQEVSVVVLEKKLLDKVDKRDREIIMETMKKGPLQLTRLRHPRLLVVQHPMEESK